MTSQVVSPCMNVYVLSDVHLHPYIFVFTVAHAHLLSQMTEESKQKAYRDMREKDEHIEKLKADSEETLENAKAKNKQDLENLRYEYDKYISKLKNSRAKQEAAYDKTVKDLKFELQALQDSIKALNIGHKGEVEQLRDEVQVEEDAKLEAEAELQALKASEIQHNASGYC